MRNPKFHILLVFLLIATGNATYAQLCQPFIDSLNAMVARDQAIRMAPWNEENSQKMAIIDSTNTSHLKALIAQYGFPTWELVGHKASYNAWLIAQHSYSYLPWYLKQYRKAVAENNADKHCLAYMEDRYLTIEGLPQIYGTQLVTTVTIDTVTGFLPIIDPKNLNQRRLSMNLGPIEDFIQNIDEIDSLVIAPYYLDYMANYYPNNAIMYVAVEAYYQHKDASHLPEFYISNGLYPFPGDLEVLAGWVLEGDTTEAVKLAKRMVLCGKHLDEEWLLPELLMDTIHANYDELRAEYEMMIAKDDNAMLNAITSFDTLVKVLDNGFYPRYTIDAWNKHIKELIAERAKTLKANDYQAFFDWLFEQVMVGNYHLFDYAELYDEVYYRLFGKSYYGQKTFDKEVPLFEEEKVNERRWEIQLPSIEVWEGIRGMSCHIKYNTEHQ